MHVIGYKLGYKIIYKLEYGTSKNINKDNYKRGDTRWHIIQVWNMVQAVDKIWNIQGMIQGMIQALVQDLQAEV